MRKYTDAAGVEQEYGYNALPALLIGGAVGLIAGLLGIGGWIGARISRRIGSVLLIRIMCGTLLLFAVRMIIT